MRKGAYILATCLVMTTFTAVAEVVVIGNPGLKASSLSGGHAAKLWLGQSRMLEDNTRVQVVDNAKLQEEFAGKVLNKDVKQLKAHWAKLVFTGQANPPELLADDASVKKWVASTPNGLGYVDAKSVDGSVKVLMK